jgi:hypothetical protein
MEIARSKRLEKRHFSSRAASPPVCSLEQSNASPVLYMRPPRAATCTMLYEKFYRNMNFPSLGLEYDGPSYSFVNRKALASAAGVSEALPSPVTLFSLGSVKSCSHTKPSPRMRRRNWFAKM